MIIVTGATGFIGSVLCQDLNQIGMTDILIVDHVPPSDRALNTSNLKYKDFIFANQLQSYLKTNSQQIEYIFHIGACSSTTETNEEYLKLNNTFYTDWIFDYCANHKIPLQYASSAAVYGNGSLGFNDLTPPKELTPLNLYGWSKLNFDKMALNKSLTPPQWYGLRYFNVYGPNESHKGDMASLVFKAFTQILKTSELKLFKSARADYGDGLQLRDFVYVKDISNWMIHLMNNPNNTPSGIYNMGYGLARTWLDLANCIFSSLNLPLNINWIEMPDSIKDQYQYFTEADMNRFFNYLPKPNWPLELGVKDYIQNHLLPNKDSFI